MSRSFWRTRSLWYSAAILLAGFTGCSCESEKASMVNPEGIHQAYSVNYVAGSNKTAVSARFRFGGPTGTNLDLDGVAKITHSSCAMKKTNPFNLGVHYVGDCDGCPADHTFDYIDTAGKLYQNSIHLAAIDFPADMPAEISRGKGVKLAFAGDPIGQDESVEVSFQQQAQPEAVARQFRNNTVGAKEVAISADELQPFAEGEATIFMVRTRTHGLQAGTSRGGSMSARYASANRKVVIVK